MNQLELLSIALSANISKSTCTSLEPKRYTESNAGFKFGLFRIIYKFFVAADRRNDESKSVSLNRIQHEIIVRWTVMYDGNHVVQKPLGDRNYMIL